MLNLYSSNRLERLAGVLVETLKARPAAPFERDIVVVQSRGMERWLRLQLAERLGVCALVEFPFPGAVIWTTIKKLLPDLRDRRELETDLLVWTLMDLIGWRRGEAGFEEVSDYLARGGTQLHLYQFARTVARLFSDYALFRPDALTAWQREETLFENDDQGRRAEVWQAALWRDLAGRYGWEPWSMLRDRLVGCLRASENASALPRRISVFGMSALPPVYLQIFADLAARCEVHLYVMQPCREYWGEIESHREAARRRRRGAGDGEDHAEIGNSLLASMGQLGRDFLDLLIDRQPVEPGGDLFEPPGRDTLLRRVQSDLLELVDAGRDAASVGDLSEGDRSVQIHVCHSPMREVEVLHDRLLDLLDGASKLAPREILVMAPDIEMYAANIEAVFGAASDRPYLPFSIADRAPHRTSRIQRSFFAVLDMARGRYGVSEVLALLDNPAVRRRFGFEAAELDPIRTWLDAVRVRWGIDADYRASLGLPAEPAHTWRQGFDRMLLGYALPGDGIRRFGDVLPYAEIEGQDAAILGKLVTFFERLTETVEGLAHDRTPRAWADELTRVLERFAAADEETEPEAGQLRAVFSALRDQTGEAGFDTALELPVVRAFLDESLGQERISTPFLSGGVTFCSLVPMRSVPFKVVCLLGMNDGEFPRNPRPPGFDLMAHRPRRGDRSARQDDRYIFLEALLSARDTFYVSYVGRDVRENTELPPSVLVSELTDYLIRSTGSAADVSDRVMTHHSLQPFHPDYFTDDGPAFSYARTYAEAGAALARKPSASTVFDGPLPPLPREPGTPLSLDALTWFFDRPARGIMEDRLGLRKPWVAAAFEDREPFDLSYGDRGKIAEILLPGLIEGDEPADPVDLLHAAGLLPHGTPGRLRGERVVSDLNEFSEQLRRRMVGQPRSVRVDAELKEARLVGRIENVYSRQRFLWRFGKLWAGNVLRAWIEHLALNLAGGEDLPRTTCLYGSDEMWTFRPVADPAGLMDGLIEHYRRGLCEPLHLFPSTSLAFAQAMRKNNDEDKAFAKARLTWLDGYNTRGERSRADYLAALFTEDALDDPAFVRDTMAVFEPLLEHREDDAI